MCCAAPRCSRSSSHCRDAPPEVPGTASVSGARQRSPCNMIRLRCGLSPPPIAVIRFRRQARVPPGSSHPAQRRRAFAASGIQNGRRRRALTGLSSAGCGARTGFSACAPGSLASRTRPAITQPRMVGRQMAPATRWQTPSTSWGQDHALISDLDLAERPFSRRAEGSSSGAHHSRESPNARRGAMIRPCHRPPLPPARSFSAATRR